MPWNLRLTPWEDFRFNLRLPDSNASSSALIFQAAFFF
jgi:hypothetical protein